MTKQESQSSWGTQSGSGRIEEYNPGNFYIRATNRYNHHTTLALGKDMAEQFDSVRINLPPELLSKISELVNATDLPYRNNQDLIRDALHHRVYQLAELRQDHNFINSFSMELLKQRIAQQIFEDEELTSTVEYLTAEAEVYVKDHNHDGVADIIHHAEEHVVPPRLRRQWREAILMWENMQERAAI